MSGLDIFAWIVLIVLTASAIGVFCIVGWLPGAPGVYVAVTHSGVTLGAHLAALIAAELLSADRPGDAGQAELAPYRPGRFTGDSVPAAGE